MDCFREFANPFVLLNAGGQEPSRIYAMNGSIRSGNVTTNEQTLMSAKTDIRDLTLNLRNLHATDVTWLNARQRRPQQQSQYRTYPWHRHPGAGIAVTDGRTRRFMRGFAGDH